MDNEATTRTVWARDGKVSAAATLALIILAAFLFAQTIKTFAEYNYIGAGIEPTSTISVTGKGEVFAVPDIARVTFSVQGEGAEPGQAQTEATRLTNEAIAYVKGLGIEDRDIRTQYFNLHPKYEQVRSELCLRGEPCPMEARIVGYRVEQSIEVKLRDTAQAGEFVAGLATLGVQNVHGPNFTIDDEEALLTQARNKAIENAKQKADELARQLGVRVVGVVHFSEDGGYSPMPYARNMKLEMDAAMGSAAPAPDMPLGENQIVTNVSITYEVR
jgi:uncharacterized protein